MSKQVSWVFVVVQLLLVLFACCATSITTNAWSRKLLGEQQMQQQPLSGTRYQRFNTGGKTPLDTLFAMKMERRDDLQNQVTDMMQQSRLHAEARRKVQEEMKMKAEQQQQQVQQKQEQQQP